jgi:toxin ParE1/3/4
MSWKKSGAGLKTRVSMARSHKRKLSLAWKNGLPSKLVATRARDLEAIAAYIASDSPAYARAVVKRIVTLTRNRISFPQSGRIVPEFQDKRIRELLAYSYRIIYTSTRKKY